MPRINLPPPTLHLDPQEARRFMLAHQRLWPPRQLDGKIGIMDFIRHVSCIQFDPINRVGRNPDLVLQSRVIDYNPEMLNELLYKDRQLLDGWDKMAAIYAATDWPYFARHRSAMRQRHGDPSKPQMQTAPEVLQAIRERGPLSSIDLKDEKKVDWSWGPTSRTRAAMEALNAMGELGVAYRVGTRRVFDLAERLLPKALLSAPDPNQSEEAYQEWHILRRIGGLGLAHPRTSEYWHGIRGVKSQVRQRVLTRLVEQGELVVASVQGLQDRSFFIRTADLATLDRVREESPPNKAAFVGALDNLIWDREHTRWIFDFDYVWEVYKPAAKRRYGYYVLPVLYGDRFVARMDPALDRKKQLLTIDNWWWEEGVEPDETMFTALAECLRLFMDYLGANRIELGEKVAGKKSMRWANFATPDRVSG